MKKIFTLLILVMAVAVSAMAQKAEIISATVTRTDDDATGKFTMTVKVKYANAVKIRAFIYLEDFKNFSFPAMTVPYDTESFGDGEAVIVVGPLSLGYITKDWIQDFWLAAWYSDNKNDYIEYSLEVPAEASSAITSVNRDASAPAQVEIVSLKGVTVQKGTEVDESALPAGVYVKKVTAADGKVSASKILVQ